MDHTISNAYWRDNMIGNVPWNDYYAAGKYDKPFYNVLKLIDIFDGNGDKVIVITARPEKFRGMTLNWLMEYRVNIHDLLMRPDDNYSKSSEIKIKLISTYFNNIFDNIGFFIDDNEEAIKEFQKLGIATLHVGNIK
jgi:hypothetical protein